MRRLAIALAVFLVAEGTNTCSWDEQAVFHLENRPDEPLATFVDGRLDIVQPTFGASYLALAYRYLDGTPPSRHERDEAMAFYEHRMQPDEQGDPFAEWIAARKSIPGVRPIESIDVYAPNDSRMFFVNCAGHAFTTAARTLAARSETYGPRNAAVRAWVETQDAVFANCGGDRVDLPAPPATLPPLLRADRDYQLAALKFYRREFDDARRQLAAIAADESSPWREVAPLVAARALIRRASLRAAWYEQDAASLTQAEKELRAIIANRTLASMHEPARQLLGFVLFRLVPDFRRAELGTAILCGEIERQNFSDYTDLFLFPRQPPQAMDELTEWILAFRAGKSDALIAGWRERKSMPWLAAALARAGARDEGVEAMLAVAARVPESSPGFVMIRYHAARLHAARGDADLARAEATRLLARDLGPSARNLVHALRLPLARDLDEFLRDAVRVAAGRSFDGIDFETESFPKLIDEDAANAINVSMPLDMLVEATRRADEHLRPHLLAAAWTRAVALERHDVAASLVPAVIKEWPEMKSALTRYRRTPRTREAVDVLLQFPVLSPYVYANLHRGLNAGDMSVVIHSDEHENWWCHEGRPFWSREERPAVVPRFLQPLRAEAAAEREQLARAGSGATFLLRETTKWARAVPDDARVPEALSMAIKGTQWACPDHDTRRLAERAFRLLHTRYRGTQAAKETKYWYSGE